MSTDTQQFLFRLMGWMIALSIGAFEFGMLIAVFWFGDGEGIKIIQTLATPMLGAFGAAVAFVLGHQVLIAKLASSGQLNPSTAQASSTGAQAAPASESADSTLASIAASVAGSTAATDAQAAQAAVSATQAAALSPVTANGVL